MTPADVVEDLRMELAGTLDDLRVLLREKPEFPKTSIMATIGPACFSPDDGVDLVREMVDESMNMARINLAHVRTEGDRRTVSRLLDSIDRAVESTREPIVVVADLAGPKIRIGAVRERTGTTERDRVAFRKDDTLRLTLDPDFGVTEGTYGEKDTKISLRSDAADFELGGIEPGKLVVMDDGCFRMRVEAVEGRDIVCRALSDWTLLPNKGVNFPGCRITASALTAKDHDDLDWLFHRERGAARDRIHYMSLSFVKHRQDVELLRKLLSSKYDQERVRVISKIETVEAVSGPQDDYPVFRDLLEASDAIMVARGDLGAEVPFEDVPEIQRRLIELTHDARKPTIVATQMLESMVEHEFATRAEVTDVTNAILEGTDVTMLSAETSRGRNPVAAVRTMDAIAKRACRRITVLTDEDAPARVGTGGKIIDAMADPVVEFAERLGAKLIVAFTHSGDTPIAIAHYRPKQPVVAITSNKDTVARLVPYRGIYAVYINYVPKNSDDHRDVCRRLLEQELHLTEPGDLSVVTMSIDTGDADRRMANSLYVLKH